MQYLINSSSKTIESFVHKLSEHLLQRAPLSQGSDGQSSLPGDDVTLTIELHRPHAIPFADSASVRITRCLRDFQGPVAGDEASANAGAEPSSETWLDGGKAPATPVRAWLAIGSNIGDRVSHIRTALRLLSAESAPATGTGSADGIRITRTSRLYQSRAMYVEDQADFTNGALEIETRLSPIELLLALKRVERATGRQKTFANGPRVIDLDLLFYDTRGDGAGGRIRCGARGDAEGSLGEGCEWLQVPHWGVAEREFVLRPLCE